MGEIDHMPFYNTCKRIFPICVAEEKSTVLCTLWEGNLRKPFQMVKGDIQEVIDEEDEMLRTLRGEWGDEIYKAVITALKEMNEYNSSGRFVVSELWNFTEGRRASLKEVISYMLQNPIKPKRKRATDNEIPPLLQEPTDSIPSEKVDTSSTRSIRKM